MNRRTPQRRKRRGDLAVWSGAAVCVVCLVIAGGIACQPAPPGHRPQAAATPPARPAIRTSHAAAVPPGRTKGRPDRDAIPPRLHSDLWEKPVPLPGAVNTAGMEDSPFILPDGNTLYFWFTPDPNVAPRKQLFDGTTGIWVSRRQADGRWGTPTRVLLQGEADGLVLDGCPFVQDDVLYFCSARGGNLGELDVWKASRRQGAWRDWKNAGARMNRDYQVGELHITADGKRMYFASRRKGGKGGWDIWYSDRGQDGWGRPVNVEAVNTPGDENQPFVTEDGRELWYTGDTGRLRKTPAVFRSLRTPTGWSKPQEIVSHFAGEPTLDRAGNLYFVHHFIRNGKPLECDIYVAKRKR